MINLHGCKLCVQRKGGTGHEVGGGEWSDSD